MEQLKIRFAMKIFVTGVAGYIGTSFVKEAKAKLGRNAEIVGIDVKDLPQDLDIQFSKVDILNYDEVEKLSKGSDVVVHMAFVLNPPKDREHARRVNIDGTRNILRAAQKNNVKKVIVLTSASTYGAHPDNPLFMREDHPLRGDLNFGFWYPEDKAVQDRITQIFMKENPEISTYIVRPVIVFGEGVNNFISQGFFNPPVVGIFNKNIPFQYIHESDVSRGILLMIERDLSGPFNLSGSGVVTMKRSAEIMRKPAIYIPPFLHRPMYEFMVRAKIIDPLLPFAAIDFFKYPWTLNTQRAEEELGFKPELSSEDAFTRAWLCYKHKTKRLNTSRITK